MNSRTAALSALLASLLLVAFSAPPASAAAEVKVCGVTVAKDTWSGTQRMEVTATNAACAPAKRILARYAQAPRSKCMGQACFMEISGWWCSAASSAQTATNGDISSCEKGRKHAQASQPTCAPGRRDGVRVVKLERLFGCKTGLRLAVATVNGDGYYSEGDLYCRWGQGGTRTIRVGGVEYIPGFCTHSGDEREATFLARRTD
jgi:hypothetical protein